MPRAQTSSDWRRLSQAARKERDPKRFVQLLKQLYDLVNADEEKPRVSGQAKVLRVKEAQEKPEIEAA